MVDLNIEFISTAFCHPNFLIPSQMNLPEQKQELLNHIVDDLKAINNIEAIVLGGSYATGRAAPTSDIDLGIYYSEKNPFDINDIKSIANKYSLNNDSTVTQFYEWGPWVNGGAWIETEAGEIDFLYRNIEHVESTIAKAQNGEYENHFEQQPPYGFSSVIYLAETKTCIALYDPNQRIEHLKASVATYPQKLKDNLIQYSLWSAEFTIWHADRFSEKQDTFNTIGCLTKATKNIVDALFAINEIYPISDKRAIEILENSNKVPAQLKQKVEAILFVDKKTPQLSINALKDLFEETKNLSAGKYKPFYQL